MKFRWNKTFGWECICDTSLTLYCRRNCVRSIHTYIHLAPSVDLPWSLDTRIIPRRKTLAYSLIVQESYTEDGDANARIAPDEILALKVSTRTIEAWISMKFNGLRLNWEETVRRYRMLQYLHCKRISLNVEQAIIVFPITRVRGGKGKGRGEEMRVLYKLMHCCTANQLWSCPGKASSCTKRSVILHIVIATAYSYYQQYLRSNMTVTLNKRGKGKPNSTRFTRNGNTN